MHLEATIERVWRWTWRPRLSEFGVAIGGHERATLEMHLEATIEPGLEMHLEAVIERVWRFTWRPQLSEFGDAIGGHD